MWHVDANDKLKPFSFSIHGYIDGNSRKALWLEGCSPNKNPRIVAKFYMDAVTELKGVPKFVRGERGVENITVASIIKL